jgi:hypothetical protein
MRFARSTSGTMRSRRAFSLGEGGGELRETTI